MGNLAHGAKMYWRAPTSKPEGGGEREAGFVLGLRSCLHFVPGATITYLKNELKQASEQTK